MALYNSNGRSKSTRVTKADLVGANSDVKVYQRLPDGSLGEFLRVEKSADLEKPAIDPKVGESSMTELKKQAIDFQDQLAEIFKEKGYVPTIYEIRELTGTELGSATVTKHIEKALERYEIPNEVKLVSSIDGSTQTFRTLNDVADFFGCKPSVVRACWTLGTRFRKVFFVKRVVVG